MLNLCLAVGKTEKIKKKKTKNKKQAFLFALDDICMIFPLLVKFCLFTGKTEMKKEETFTTTTSSLKSQSSGFCSYDTPEHKTSLEIYTIKRLETFFFSLGDICVFPPLLVKLCLLTRKTEMKKEKETFTTTSSLKFQSNAFCSCDTIKRLEFFFFFLIVNVTMSEQKILY